MPATKVTTDEFLEAVDIVRASYGSCTVKALADHLGLHWTGVRRRVDRLVAIGVLEQSELPGSIRRARQEGAVGVSERL